MSASPNRSLAEISRHAWRLAIACLLASVALGPANVAWAADPVLTPPEVRTAPNQFIVVAVANPVTGSLKAEAEKRRAEDLKIQGQNVSAAEAEARINESAMNAWATRRNTEMGQIMP